MDTVVFAGSANPRLASAYASSHSFRMGNSSIDRFANSEIKVTIEEDVAGKTCIVVQSISNPANDRFMELAFFIDALKRSSAKEVKLIIPYFGYARQNIQHRVGECVSAHVVISILESLGVSEITTIELHDEATAGVFSIPFQTKSGLALIAAEMKKIGLQNVVIASPDQGGIERARIFAGAFYDKDQPDLVTVEKKRNLDGIHDSKAVELYGSVEGKTVVIVDDVSTSGGTMLNAAQLILEKGAREVYGAVVHADFAQGLSQKLVSSPFKGWFITDTIEDITLSLPQDFFHIVSVSAAL